MFKFDASNIFWDFAFVAVKSAFSVNQFSCDMKRLVWTTTQPANITLFNSVGIYLLDSY